MVFIAFFLLPMARLFVICGGDAGAPTAVLTETRYLSSGVSTVLAGATTVVTLVISGIAGVFLRAIASGPRC